MNLPIEKLITLRHELHKNPELAHKEEKTSKRIIKFLQQYSPDKIIDKLGGHGIAAIFDSGNEGPEVLIRADLDALPIQEENNFDYRSETTNVSHKCGHDGHMTIVSGLAPLLNQNKLKKGKVILLYQPAEEKGEGAEKVLNDPAFNQLNPDYVFALHNLPGFDRGSIILRNKHFAAASKGMIIKLQGKTSHAAEPQNGNSPAIAVAEMIKTLNSLPSSISGLKDFALVTVIHVWIGKSAAFGTTPGFAEVMATLRSTRNDDMNILTTQAIKEVKKIAEADKLKIDINWTEEFPATINNNECFDLIKESAEENNYRINLVDQPFRWSEDFGHFTSKFKGALFGIGSGKDHPDLHNPDYDFPDEIIETGTFMFYSIIKNILKD